jgi:hypothetical protein
MSVTTAAGSKVSIGPTTAAANLAAYQALSYVEVGEVQNLGEFGDQANDVTFIALSNSRVRHFKGARDAGVLALVVGRDPLDVGQIALRAAEKTKFSYAFKVLAADAADANDPDSEFYFHALVQSARDTFGEADNVVMTTFNLGIVTEIFEDPSVATP